jgi:hypothetical protein
MSLVVTIVVLPKTQRSANMTRNTIQALDARYIDGAKLVALLVQLFGAGNYRIDV